MAAAAGWAATAVPASPPMDRGRLVRAAERLALFYLLAIAADGFGFVDVLVFGDAYDKTSESVFAQALWPLAYLLVATLALLHRSEVLAAALRCWWLLPFPALALLSVLWSLDPVISANAAIRMSATTAIGIYLGARFPLPQVARALLVVLLCVVAPSVLAGLAGLDFAILDGTVRGLFHHKNTLGNRAALLALTALALIFAARRRWLALAGLSFGLAGAFLSQSAAGLALAALAAAALPVALSLQGGRIAVAFRLALLGTAIATAGFLLVDLRIDPVAATLAALERDPSLTGRADLWQAAGFQIAARPLLGAGFDAFWKAGLDWRTAAVLEELGLVLHFHNSFLEVGVQLGAAGLACAVLACCGYGVLALRALRMETGGVSLWPALFGAALLALALVEYELFVKHNLFHILFVAIPVASATELARRRWGERLRRRAARVARARPGA